MPSYAVFLVQRLGLPRNHHAIYIQLDDDGAGHTFHVTGNIQNGMVYESGPASRPEDHESFVDKSLIGSVDAADYDRVDAICRAIPAPRKQFHGAQRLFPGEPLRRCQEWTREAIEALETDGVLQRPR